jgi:hypothetical protein
MTNWLKENSDLLIQGMFITVLIVALFCLLVLAGRVPVNAQKPESKPTNEITLNTPATLKILDSAAFYIAKDGEVMFSNTGVMENGTATNITCDPVKAGDFGWHNCKATPIKECK